MPCELEHDTLLGINGSRLAIRNSEKTRIKRVSSIDEAIAKANNTEYGLTAGIFSENKEQQDEFFNKIQAGVVYANREASATTAALVSSQPFVGWKNSGSTGKGAGGEYYLQQFLRTQTQTRCD